MGNLGWERTCRASRKSRSSKMLQRNDEPDHRMYANTPTLIVSTMSSVADTRSPEREDCHSRAISFVAVAVSRRCAWRDRWLQKRDAIASQGKKIASTISRQTVSDSILAAAAIAAQRTNTADANVPRPRRRSPDARASAKLVTRV